MGRRGLPRPGPALSLAIAPALAELVGSGAVRLIDADLLHTSDDGGVTIAELEYDEGAPSRTWTASCASC